MTVDSMGAGALFKRFIYAHELDAQDKMIWDLEEYGLSLPSQENNNGKFLTTNGSSPSWNIPVSSMKGIPTQDSQGNNLSTYTIAEADKGYLLWWAEARDLTITIPETTNSQYFSTGFEVIIVNGSTSNKITISPASNVRINNSSNSITLP